MSKHITSTTVTVDVDVDITTDDLSDEDLLDLVEERGLTGAAVAEEIKEAIEEMFFAFRLGREDRALELARKVAELHTGRLI